VHSCWNCIAFFAHCPFAHSLRLLFFFFFFFLFSVSAAAAASYKDTLPCSIRRRKATQCLLASTRGSLDSGGLPQPVVWNTLKVCCGNLATKGEKENHLLMLLWLNGFAQIYGEFVLLESFGVEHSPKLLLSISIHQSEHYW
jgi:hypothetical protein